MTDAVMMIAAEEARLACRGESDIILRLKKAMNCTKNFWMSNDEQLRFKAACAAAMLEGSEPDKERIARSFKSVAVLSAILDGLPIDVAEAAKARGDDIIPLLALWHEANGR